jgi:hypothetical protein
VRTTVDPAEPRALQTPVGFGERQPGEIAAAEKKRDEIERELANDATIYRQPSLRSYRLYMQTEVVRNLNGAPVTDEKGRGSTLTLAETLWQIGVANVLDPKNPKQYDYWLGMMTFLHGKMPNAPDGPMPPPPAPPPGDTDTVPTGEVSPEASARRFMEMMTVMKQIADEESDRNRKATAIDVKGELIAQAQALEKKGV